MAGRRSNGEGSITYDKRRKKPFRARVTEGWEIDEVTGVSKQKTKDIGSFKTRGEAAQALAEYLNRPYDLDNKNITFKELYERWYQEYMVEKNSSMMYRVKSAYQYCSYIYDKKVRDISIIDMKTCIYKGVRYETRGKYKGQEKAASPSTQVSIKYMFNHIFKYAIEARIVDRNFAREFTLDKEVFAEKEKQQKIKIPFSEEEMDKLWRSIDFVPFADMIIFACYSGWRPSELVALKIENVNLEDKTIKGGIKSDAGRNRVVPIHSLVYPIFEKYYNEAIRVNSKYLFNDTTKKKGIGLSYDQYLSRFNNVLELLNFRLDITPHYTRHTFITKAKAAKMNDNIIKLIVGHEITDLTERVYTHREVEELRAEIELITK